MKARELPQQEAEAGIAKRALNRMTSLGMPVFVKVKENLSNWCGICLVLIYLSSL